MNTNNTQSTSEQQPLPFPDPPASAAKETPEGVTLAELQAENEKLKEKLRLRDAHEDLTHKLKKAGARTPKLLLEAAKHALKFTAEGMLGNAGELVEDLKTRFPEQFGRDISDITHMSIDAGSGRTALPTLTREALAKMKPDEIAKLDWAEVKQALAS